MATMITTLPHGYNENENRYVVVHPLDDRPEEVRDPDGKRQGEEPGNHVDDHAWSRLPQEHVSRGGARTNGVGGSGDRHHGYSWGLGSCGSTGKTTMNRAPCPGLLSTRIVPPCARTIWELTYSPSPSPPKC